MFIEIDMGKTTPGHPCLAGRQVGANGTHNCAGDICCFHYLPSLTKHYSLSTPSLASDGVKPLVENQLLLSNNSDNIEQGPSLSAVGGEIALTTIDW